MYKKELEKRLAPFMRNGTIESWNDKEILPGIEWDKEIKKQFEESQMILFLISDDFFVSNYINNIELTSAFDRYRKGEVIIVPVIIRPTDFSTFEFVEFQVLPKDGRPVSTWEIANGNTEKALDLLMDVSLSIGNRDLLNYTMLLTSRFKRLKENNNMGVISSADASISHAQINSSLLSLVGDYDFH